ncbi:hypothetical protein AGRA3207_005654 [Actinomadura graeca]|uniref:Uncharacterized protein n=1 Tax=Actinomadura graeca TaxID=2750812 RepID=A0ABX8R030_9ACTN|nr:hypothetical protein [Actinomadura graeca]QXJ24347.1 hypothetical protein AGRA3207_005654 [Actinomadura graeca]
MTYLSGLLGLLAIAMLVALAALTVRHDRAIRRDAPGSSAEGHPQGTSLMSRHES